MKTHDLKTWPEPFAAIVRGSKTFEIRHNDRDYAVGDLLVLREWLPDQYAYTGRTFIRKVTYLVCGEWGLPPDIVVMALAAPSAT